MEFICEQISGYQGKCLRVLTVESLLALYDCRLSELINPRRTSSSLIVEIGSSQQTYAMAPSKCIPSVDLSAFTAKCDSQARRRETASMLAQSCHLHGCVGVTGHGVSTALLKRAFEMSRKLFDLPMEEKMKAPHPKGPTPHRGYSAPGKEKAFTKEDLETDDEAHRESLRKIMDCKARELMLALKQQDSCLVMFI